MAWLAPEAEGARGESGAGRWGRVIWDLILLSSKIK